MSVTTERSTTSTTSAATGSTDTVTVVRRRPPWIVVAVTGAALATCAVVGTWAWVATRPAPLTDAAVGNSWTASYGPGSSVYREQVPPDPTAWTWAYGPGSSTYDEQVPDDPTAWTAGYGVGSSVYAQQVPSAAGEQTALSPDQLMGLRWTEGPTAALIAHYAAVPATR